MEGKSKMTQNRDKADRKGTSKGLRAEGTESAAQVASRIPD